MNDQQRWLRVAALSDFSLNKPIVITAKGRAIAVYQLEDGFYAIEDSCSHQGLPLSEGPCFDGQVECPFHGARFCIKTGTVLAPPAFSDIETFKTRLTPESMVEVYV